MQRAHPSADIKNENMSLTPIVCDILLGTDSFSKSLEVDLILMQRLASDFGLCKKNIKLDSNLNPDKNLSQYNLKPDTSAQLSWCPECYKVMSGSI